MTKGFIIIFDHTLAKDILDEFFEIIRSSYVSKKAENNIFVISVATGIDAEMIYRTIQTKLTKKINFMVVGLDHFFGNLPKEVFDWIRQTFPDIKLRSDGKKTAE